MRRISCAAAMLLFVALAAGQAKPSPTPDHHERKPQDAFRLQPLEEVDLPQYKEYRGYTDRFAANAGAAYDEVK